MSTVPSTGISESDAVVAQGLYGLIDDAAVFPPGNAPLEVALRRHLQHRRAWYAPLVGPLLVRASDIEPLAQLADSLGDETAGVRVGVIGRPGVAADLVLTAALLVEEHQRLDLAGIEIGWSAYRPGSDLPVPGYLAVEVPLGDEQDIAIGTLAEDRANGGAQPIAKFRTGATPTWPWPDEVGLAAFLVRLASARVPGKLTGGLHHAVRQTLAGEEHHGVLNVLHAVDAARAGADVADVAGVLARRDAPALAEELAALTPDRWAGIRDLWVSYGCCEVRDPLGELVDLGLLPQPAVPPLPGAATAKELR